MKHTTTVSITYFATDQVELFGVDGLKKTVLRSIGNDHDIWEDTAEWHICSCGADCKIILIIQARRKNEPKKTT